MNKPLDDATWPEKLTARVVKPGCNPTIHGYSAEKDLAINYPHSDTIFLTLTGELPNAQQSHLFNVALQFLAPTSISEAPVHATVIANICAAKLSSVFGIASTALAEQAEQFILLHKDWLDVLNNKSPEIAPAFIAANKKDAESVDRLHAALLDKQVMVQVMAYNLSRSAALIAVLHKCGLNEEQMQCAIVFAKLPVVLAEALATPKASFMQYPLMLPRIEYQGV